MRSLLLASLSLLPLATFACDDASNDAPDASIAPGARAYLPTDGGQAPPPWYCVLDAPILAEGLKAEWYGRWMSADGLVTASLSERRIVRAFTVIDARATTLGRPTLSSTVVGLEMPVVPPYQGETLLLRTHGVEVPINTGYTTPSNPGCLGWSMLPRTSPDSAYAFALDSNAWLALYAEFTPRGEVAGTTRRVRYLRVDAAGNVLEDHMLVRAP